MMSSSVMLRPGVLAAKQWLAQERAKLKQQHDGGSPSIQVCSHLADIWDHVVLGIYEEALAELSPADRQALDGEIALVAHGGYGRREVAPYSDVDLMILHSCAASRVAPLARRMVCDLSDVGLIVGQSVRTVSAACIMALRDATIFTSLIESRLLTGSEPLFNRFNQKFRAKAQRHWRRLVTAVDKSRTEERLQFGDTVYLLEPNVKRSPGGLRDLQLLRWVGFARYGQASADDLERSGVLSPEDHAALARATEFLLRVRNELQFHGGKAQDVLDRTEQVRQAQALGFAGASGMLPVEQFMREYFRNTSAVLHIVPRFVEGARHRADVRMALAPVLSRRLDGNYRIGPRSIWATRSGLQKLQQSLEEILHLAELASRHDRRITHGTWEAVRRAAPGLPDTVTPAAAARFLSLLEHPRRLGAVLHDLHEVGVLEKLIPAMVHARCLLQFNEYHKFTVDEHCLRAVEEAALLERDSRPWAEVYRSIPQKRILHLALLIHDLGKGFAEDHSEVGRRIAEETAARLQLPPRDAETLKFLVHQHLIMSHLAFRRDTSDDQLIVRFAVEVGSTEWLRLLFVLTCADLAAVGPGVLSSWKGEVLHELYLRTLRHLSGDSPSLLADERRSAVKNVFVGDPRATWFDQQIDALPSAYLTSTPPDQVAAELRRLQNLRHGEVKVWHRTVPETKTVEYTIGTYEGITPGIVHKLTGALSSQGLQILAADINTMAEGLVLDRFRVQDPDYAGQPPPERQQEIERCLQDALISGQVPAFRRVWRAASSKTDAPLPGLPTQVRVDNTTSQRFTIVDVFASDRMGLMYTTTRTLFELGLSVSLAKISTYLDQGVDVFYVTDQNGRKIMDEARLENIRQRLLEAIEKLEQEE